MKGIEVFIFGLINFSILIATLFIFFKRLSRQFFYARRSQIKKEMTETASLLREAKLKSVNANTLHRKIDEEITLRKNLVKTQCHSECKSIIDEANKRAAHIIDSSHKFEKDERIKARLDMRKALVIEAWNRAEKKLKEKMDNVTSLKITRNGLSEFENLIHGCNFKRSEGSR